MPSSSSPTRRAFLGLGLGALAGGGLFALGKLALDPANPAPSLPDAADDPGHQSTAARAPTTTPPSKAQQTEQLARGIVETRLTDIVAFTADRLHAGVEPHLLLNAAFLAPVLQSGDQSDIHSMLVIDAIRPMLTLSSPEGRLLPLFWAVANACEWTRVGDPAPLPGPPRPFARAQDARASFNGALDGRDAEAAEVAIAALLRLGERQSAVEALALGGCASFTDPHRMIFVAQSLRALDIFGWTHAEPVLRAVARHLARSASPAADNIDLQLALTLDPLPDRPGPADPEAAAHLAEALDAGEASRPAELVADLLQSGATTASVHDALARLANGTMKVDHSASGLGVHATTLLDALLFTRDQTPLRLSPSARQLLTLQAAAWIARIHLRPLDADLPSSADPAPTPLDLDALLRPDAEAPADPSSDASPLERAGRVRSWLDQGGDGRRLMEVMRQQVALAGSDAHDFKYLNAIDALAARSDAETRRRLLSTAALARPFRAPEPWSRRDEARAAIAKLSRR